MLGEFLNAVSAVVVLLMLMAVGYFMGTKGWMKAEEKKFLSKYIINIAVPCNCINGLLNNLDQSMLAQAGLMLVSAIIGVVITILLGMGLATLLRLPKNRWGVFAAMVGVSNTLFVGLPLSTQLFGDVCVPYVMIYYLANTIFTQSVILMLVERSGTASHSRGIKGFLKDVFTKPPILTVIASVLMLIVGFRPPEVFMSFAKYISGSVSPLALIYCGFIIYELGLSNLRPSQLRQMKGLPTMLAARLVISPLICAGMCRLFGITGLAYQVFVVESALPVVSQVTVMAGDFGADDKYAATGATLSTLACFITIPVLMVWMGWTLLTVAAAAGGGLLLMRLRVPGGMLVGAILGAVLVNLTTGQAYIWPQTRVVAQVLTGAYIGCLVTTEDLRHLPRVIRPYLAVMSTFLALNLAVGFFIWRVTDLDLLTSLFCAAPGGMTDTPLIALDMGADASMVAVMQFVRMVFGMACLPSIIVLADRKIEGDQMVPEEGQGTHSLERKKAHVSLRKFLPTFAVALAAGILGKLSGVPAGTLSASLIAVIVLKFAGSAPPMPMWVRRLAQVVSGCCIGAGITRDQIFQLRQLILPALVLIAGYILVCVGMGRAISRAFRMDLKESMLSLSPAGATEMALIAADLGVHSTNLVVLQICRLLGVTVIFPQIFALLSNLIG